MTAQELLVAYAKSGRNFSEADLSIVGSFQVTIRLQRELLELSGDANDEGTNALMSDYIREQEKLVWMFSAFLDN